MTMSTLTTFTVGPAPKVFADLASDVIPDKQSLRSEDARSEIHFNAGAGGWMDPGFRRDDIERKKV